MEGGEEGAGGVGNTMTILNFPTELWRFFIPGERVMMMRLTSRTGKEKTDGSGADVEVFLNMKEWYKERRSNEYEKRKMILDKVGGLTEKFKVKSLGLMNFGMTVKDIPQIRRMLEKCTNLECLELAHNEIGAGLRDILGIQALTSLTTLNLKRVNRYDHFVVSLKEIVNFFPFLSHLCLEGNRMGLMKETEGTGAVLVRPALKFLCLKENYVCGEGLLSVREVIGKCPGLTELDLSHNLWRNHDVDMLVGMFSKCKLISTLNFDGNDMDHDTDLELTLANALSELEMLTDLNLNGNRLDDFNFMGLVLRKCTGIQYLDLGSARIRESGATALAGVLVTCAELRMLNLHKNLIGIAGVQAIAGGIGHCAHLNGLNMSDNEIGDAGAEALAVVVGNVKFLNVSKCGLGARGCEALVRLPFQQLEDLDLSDNAIQRYGVEVMADAAGSWPALKTLSISGNMIGMHGTHAVVRVLKEAKGLTELQLSGNDIQDKGVEILTHGLVACENLRELWLSTNNITDRGATCLAGVLPRCTSLTELFISYNEKIGRAGVRALQEAEEGSSVTVDVRQRLWTRGSGGGE
jgi:Ran GTPase-activating protein (RanGAP) involved in mRNA processing and transport